MRHELTTWVHSGPVAREQAAEQWTDRQHVLGHELVVASQKQAAQQSHQHKVDMLRINLEQNEWEEEQAGQLNAFFCMVAHCLRQIICGSLQPLLPCIIHDHGLLQCKCRLCACLNR